MEERKNNNVVMVVILTVLVMLVLGLVGFIVYDKIINKTNEPSTGENNSDEQNKDVAVDYDLYKAKELVGKYYFTWYGNTTFDKMTENDMKYIAYQNVKKEDFETVDCKLFYETAQETSRGEYLVNDNYYCDSATTAVSYEILNSVYKQLFGEDSNIAKESFKWNGGGIYDYVEKFDKFVYLGFIGGGDYVHNFPIYDVLSAKLTNNDKLTINVGYTYIVPEPEKDLYYAQFDKNIIYKDVSEVEKDFVQKNSDKVNVLKFNFEKENNGFVLKNIEA